MNLKKLIYNIMFWLLMFLMNNINAQEIKRTSNWYFGFGAGLMFNTNPPTVITGAMVTIEGCASMSDTNGNILFYTNGVKVWDKSYNIMDNGSGLKGNVSSTQSCIIIPFPDNDSLFYIFTTDPTNPPVPSPSIGGFRYSIVNINANNGFGSVIIKNELLYQPICEKLTATYHSNGKDIWVSIHEFGSNCFVSYLITKDGLINCPIKSCEGSVHGASSVTDVVGSMKYSPDGNLLATTVYDYLNKGDYIELFEFNNLTSKLKIKDSSDYLFGYGIEFSPNSKILYATSRNDGLFQFDISKNNMSKNKQKLFPINSYDQIAGIQMAIDGKLYVAVEDSQFLAVINRPDSIGDSSLTVFKGTSIVPRRSEGGLPNFISTYFYQPKIDFNYSENCTNDSVIFKEKYSDSIYKIEWNIYKNTSLIQTYNFSNPNHTFLDTGLYDVELIINTDTVKKQILIEPKILNQNDTFFCNTSDNFEIKIPENYRCIDWNIGKDTNIYNISKSGNYIVSAYNIQGCYVTDSIKVVFSNISKPNIYQKNDSLYTDSLALKYTWYRDNDELLMMNYKLKITDIGKYSLKITNKNSCKNYSDSILISCNINQPNIKRNGDTLFTDSLTLNYKWFKNNLPIENSQMPKLHITDTGNYYVKITNQYGCEDSSIIYNVDCKNTFIPNIKRNGLSDSLGTDSIGLKYTWFLNGNIIQNSNKQRIQINQKGNYQLEIEQEFGCKKFSQIMNISILDIQNYLFHNLNLYPNPNKGIFTIKGDLTQNISLKIEITNILGQTIYNGFLEQNSQKVNQEINLNNELPNGVYILKLYNDESSQSIKFYIEK